jgi:hypothetical protein
MPEGPLATEEESVGEGTGVGVGDATGVGVGEATGVGVGDATGVGVELGPALGVAEARGVAEAAEDGDAVGAPAPGPMGATEFAAPPHASSPPMTDKTSTARKIVAFIADGSHQKCSVGKPN